MEKSIEQLEELYEQLKLENQQLKDEISHLKSEMKLMREARNYHLLYNSEDISLGGFYGD